MLKFTICCYVKYTLSPFVYEQFHMCCPPLLLYHFSTFVEFQMCFHLVLKISCQCKFFTTSALVIKAVFMVSFVIIIDQDEIG